MRLKDEAIRAADDQLKIKQEHRLQDNPSPATRQPGRQLRGQLQARSSVSVGIILTSNLAVPTMKVQNKYCFLTNLSINSVLAFNDSSKIEH